MANVQKELAEAQAQRDRVVSERGQAEQALQKLSADRDAGTAALDALRKRQADAQGELATLTETLATRNKEAAAVDERLASARQDLSAAQAKLAEVRQQLATPPAAAPSKPARWRRQRPEVTACFKRSRPHLSKGCSQAIAAYERSRAGSSGAADDGPTPSGASSRRDLVGPARGSGLPRHDSRRLRETRTIC